LTPSNRKRTIILSSSRINETERRRHRLPVAKRIPMKMLQSLNALAGKISPGSPTDSNANKVHMHNNNNNNNNVVHHHPYSKQQTQPSPSHSANGDQKENTWVFYCFCIAKFKKKIIKRIFVCIVYFKLNRVFRIKEITIRLYSIISIAFLFYCISFASDKQGLWWYFWNLFYFSLFLQIFLTAENQNKVFAQIIILQKGILSNNNVRLFAVRKLLIAITKLNDVHSCIAE